MIVSTLQKDLPDLNMRIIVSVVQIDRGRCATIDYFVDVYSLLDGFATPIHGGADMLPPDLIKQYKTELWESIKP